MCLPAILTRHLGRTVFNLGFSGNGKMEAELGHLFGEIDAAVLVIDCLPNMEADLIRERALPFLRALREHRPDTPIVLVEDRTYTNTWAIPSRQARHDASRRELRAAYDTLVAEGDTHLVYIEGDHLLGDDSEGAVDSSHPTDLGFMRMAAVLEPVLRELIDRDDRNG
jgi:lysophospholipase L1-like esterase